MARAHKLIRPLDNMTDHCQGAATAAVNLVVYVDYQCPSSEKANGIVESMLMHYGPQIHLAARHFPLPRHPFAMLAAEAAEAAAAQGRFWEMHALLFEHQDALDADHLRQYAHELRLDVPRLTVDLESGRFRPLIEEQVKVGKRSGVSQTPTFFINGARHDGEWDRRSLLSALEDVARQAPKTFLDLEERPFLEV